MDIFSGYLFEVVICLKKFQQGCIILINYFESSPILMSDGNIFHKICQILRIFIGVDFGYKKK